MEAMPAGRMMARRMAMRWGFIPVALISLLAGMGSVAPAPHAQAAAHVIRLAGPATSRAKPASTFTAYVSTWGYGIPLGTVDSIQTAPNTAGPAIPVGLRPGAI